jgi:UDP-glucose 4-epimerase
MKILVTGGAGFIGSHIVDNLIERGDSVVIVDNLSTGKQEYINSRAKLYLRDLCEEIDDIFSKERPEIVIHCAAQVQLRESLANPIFDAKTNIIATINVLEACRKNGVKRIIYTSTGGARVGEPEYLPVDEKHPINPCAPYGVSKHTAEHYVWMYNELYNLDYLTFCFGNVYGPRDDPDCKRVTAVFIEKMLRGESPKIFGSGEQKRDFIFVEDLANLITDSVEKNPEHKLFHLANGEKTSVNEIFAFLKDIMNFQGEAQHIDAIKGEVQEIVLDTTLVTSELGWDPKHSLYEGLKKTVDFFKK